MGAAASLEIEPTASLFFFNSDEQTIYRRTDDPDNQNFYKAAQDTGKLAQDTYCAARGSTKIYPCAADSGSKVTASYGAADGVITLGASASADKTDFGLFAGLEGPYKIAGGTYPADAQNIVGTDTGLTGFEDYFDKAGATRSRGPPPPVQMPPASALGLLSAPRSSSPKPSLANICSRSALLASTRSWTAATACPLLPSMLVLPSTLARTRPSLPAAPSSTTRSSTPTLPSPRVMAPALT